MSDWIKLGLPLDEAPADQPADHIGEVNEMVDRAELKRLAEAATPKRWKPFWGDAVQAVMCARTDKEVVFWSGFDASRTATTKAKKVALMNFIAAANPATVLSLLSLIARQEETIRADGEARKQGVGIGMVIAIAKVIDPPAFSERYRPGNPSLWERWMSGKGVRISKAIAKADKAIEIAQSDVLSILSGAREYVVDALDAHEHTDGRDLLKRIDAALTEPRAGEG